MCAKKLDQEKKSRRRVERNIAFDDERGLYYVTLNFGKDPETKKQIKKTETFKKLAQARVALRKHETARDVGQVVMPKELTLHQWFDEWMRNSAELNLADTTIYGYKQMFCNHIAPALGDMPLQKLTPQQFQRYYAEKIRAGGLSSNTVRKHHDLLNTVLRAAVRVGLILSNPAERVEPPKVIDPEHNYYNPIELQTLLQAPMNSWLLVSVYLAGYLGLRREEICGLRWSCVDFEKHQIWIRNARTSAGSRIVEKKPKNKSSERVLYCPNELETVLNAELSFQKEAIDIRISPRAQEGFVVCWPDGEPVRPNYISDRFSKIIKDNHLPKLKFHELRHPNVKPRTQTFSIFFEIFQSRTLRSCLGAFFTPHKSLSSLVYRPVVWYNMLCQTYAPSVVSPCASRRKLAQGFSYSK